MKKKIIIVAIASALIALIIIGGVGYFIVPKYFWFVLPKKEISSISIQYAKESYVFMKRVNEVEYADRIAKEITLEKEEMGRFIKELNNAKFSQYNGRKDVKTPFVNSVYQYKIEYDGVVVYVGTGHLTYLYDNGKQNYIRFNSTYGLERLERFFI